MLNLFSTFSFFMKLHCEIIIGKKLKRKIIFDIFHQKSKMNAYLIIH